jgi:pimeloyl-ACP methyl ester carboxylesterase
MLIVWGRDDPFFTVEGAKAYQRDLPKAKLHLIDAGHFALEEASDFIAGQNPGIFGASRDAFS